jgi:hypothetical protein
MEATDLDRTSVVRLDDTHELWFYTYSLGKRRLGAARVYLDTSKYSGPTKSGIDMDLEHLRELGECLKRLSEEMERGELVPPLEYARVAASHDAEWVVQVLEGPIGVEDWALDIRKYVTTGTYAGFTRKGLRLNFEWIDAVVEHLPEVCESLVDWREGRTGGLLSPPAPIGVEKTATNRDVADAVPEEYRDFF